MCRRLVPAPVLHSGLRTDDVFIDTTYTPNALSYRWSRYTVRQRAKAQYSIW